jgi:uncharacterized protein (DUF362 family)
LTLVGDDILGFLEEAEAAGPAMTIAWNGSIEARVKKAIDGLGGIGKFVKKGNSVAIKPNIAWARSAGQAANTNPEVLTAVIKLCKQAGAGRITVVEHTCDDWQTAFEMSGVRRVCAVTKARLVSGHNRSGYKPVSIPKGKILKSDECMREVLDADCFINVPIAKVHGATGMTASMKNLMGVMYDRQNWHSKGLDQCIADYASAVKADLIILDGIRVLLTRGPKGPGDTKDVGHIVASTDPVAIDAYACKLLGKDPLHVGHIVAASKLGLGQIDLKKVAQKKV